MEAKLVRTILILILQKTLGTNSDSGIFPGKQVYLSPQQYKATSHIPEEVTSFQYLNSSPSLWEINIIDERFTIDI